MKLALLAAAAALPACTDGSPLSRSMVDVWVYADPTKSSVQVSLDAIEGLDSLADAVSAGDIQVTLDNQPLVLDAQTGFTQQGGTYSAIFDLEPTASAPPTRSTIVITDGTVTWHAQLAGLFANDLAPVAPLTAGDNTFEWPSAALTNEGLPDIQTACLEVVGRSSHCTSSGDGTNSISQRYISLPSDASPGDTIVVTATRWDNAPDSGATQFMAQIKNRYVATQP